MTQTFTDPLTWLLVAGVLLVLGCTAWVLVENYQHSRQELQDQLAELERAYAAQAEVMQRMARMLTDHSDTMATLKRQAGLLPPPRRAVETSATTAQLPKVGGRPVLRSAVVGEIKMSSGPRTLRERMAVEDMTGGTVLVARQP